MMRGFPTELEGRGPAPTGVTAGPVAARARGDVGCAGWLGRRGMYLSSTRHPRRLWLELLNRDATYSRWALTGGLKKGKSVDGRWQISIRIRR